jgi:alkanesulfonate monooxygenase SsuD/methylene tetrahydromethanopterin reductase-like flavin-dependent oxidoreductase (luciferase family)
MVLLQGPVRGQFSAPVDTLMKDLKGIDDAVIADLDGDRRPDAAVTGFFPVGSPSVVHARINRFTQAGAGAFALVSSGDLSIEASRVTAGDVDGDGRNEVVVLGSEDRFLVLD